MIVCAICIPFIYYAILSYIYFMENKPADFEYPEVKWLLVSVGGALYFTAQKKAVFFFFEGKMYNWCLRQKTEELHMVYVEKATLNINKVVFFAASAIWGYAILYDSLWLPWFLGGLNPKASLLEAYKWGYYDPPKGFLFYIFFTFGYHL